MSSTWSSYKFELIGTGEQAGTWGVSTNTNLGTAIEQAIGGYVSIAMSDATNILTLTNTSAAQNARALFLNLTGTLTAARDVEVPTIQKMYAVKNATTGGFAVTLKVSGQTGVSVPNGSTVLLYNNGTDVVDLNTYLSNLKLGGNLIVGGTFTGAGAFWERGVACTDEVSSITASTSTAKMTFRMPFAVTMTGVRASLTTAQTSGSIFTVNVKKNGTTIFSTKITIDNTEKTSTTAATAPVLSTTSFADDDEITVFVDQIGDGTATGLKVTFIGYRP